MPYAYHGDTRLYYEVYGSGTPLLLISGLGGDLSFWSDSVARLKDHFQVIVFDNRGIARSDAPDAPYSMELMADDVLHLLETLGVERAHIVGFSMGGLVAQAFASKYPHKVQKLVIAASYAKMHPQAEIFLDAVLSVYETGATTKQMFLLILPWLFSPGFLSQPESAAFLEFDENDPHQQPIYAFRRQYQAQKVFDSRTLLHQIQAPALVMAGQRDALVPVEDAQVLLQGIPEARLHVHANAGHLFNVEQPEEFHRVLQEFLNS